MQTQRAVTILLAFTLSPLSHLLFAQALSEQQYRTAAARGDVQAQANLCLLYADHGKPEALKWCELAAARDNATALRVLGMAYLTGNRVRKDRRKAVQYLSQASDAAPHRPRPRDPVSLVIIGSMLWEGELTVDPTGQNLLPRNPGMPEPDDQKAARMARGRGMVSFVERQKQYDPIAAEYAGRVLRLMVPAAPILRNVPDFRKETPDAAPAPETDHWQVEAAQERAAKASAARARQLAEVEARQQRAHEAISRPTSSSASTAGLVLGGIGVLVTLYLLFSGGGSGSTASSDGYVHDDPLRLTLCHSGPPNLGEFDAGGGKACGVH